MCNKKLFKEGYLTLLLSLSLPLQRLKSSYADMLTLPIESLQGFMCSLVQPCNYPFFSFQRQRNTNRAMKTISSIKGDKMAIRSKRLELPKAPRLLANLRERRVKGAPGSARRPEVYHETLGAAGLRKRSVFFFFSFLFLSLTSGIHKAQLTWTHLVPLRVGLRAPPLLGQRRHLGWTPRAQVRHSQFPRGTFRMP